MTATTRLTIYTVDMLGWKKQQVTLVRYGSGIHILGCFCAKDMEGPGKLPACALYSLVSLMAYISE